MVYLYENIYMCIVLIWHSTFYNCIFMTAGIQRQRKELELYKYDGNYTSVVRVLVQELGQKSSGLYIVDMEKNVHGLGDQ